MADETPAPHRPRRARSLPAEQARPPGTSRRKSGAPRRTRRVGRIVGITLGSLCVLLIAGLVISGLYLRNLQTTFDDNRNVIEGLELEDETSYRTPEGTINILLLGTDSRGDQESDYRSQLGEEGERSDTMMFVHIPADRSGVYVMSIMRDLWVEIPGEGMGRVNSAFSFGQEDLVVAMVEEMLYTHIDHVAIIDFDGFSDLTTALGGVYVDNPHSFSAGQRNPDFYPEGTIRLEGDNALRYVRERRSFPTGDYVRVENQQRVVRAIVERFLSGDTLSNPQRVFDVVESITPYMEVDSALNAETVAGYALDMTHLRGHDVHMFTMPGGEHHTTTAGAEVILPDEEAMTLLRRSLANDNMDGFMHYLETSEDADSFTGEESADLTENPELSENPGQRVAERFGEFWRDARD
ncbi:LCP family protein [Nesterenkonia alba]|uniref:LCP family protein n=1 Tax=Nesterenkonia alba TaxID=515814 RepID=UPI0003B5E1ED|nr:LCP family protein [Nesterenkonia alba]